jgi:hypothetical protein
VLKALRWTQGPLSGLWITRYPGAEGWKYYRVLGAPESLESPMVQQSFVCDGKYVELHKRAGQAFPISDFGSQLNAALGAIGNAEEGWTGTILAAKLAAIVQRQADWNFRLRTEDAQALLKILDSLIDLGDRRSAALEQTEAFKGVQGSAQPKGT